MNLAILISAIRLNRKMNEYSEKHTYHSLQKVYPIIFTKLKGQPIWLRDWYCKYVKIFRAGNPYVFDKSLKEAEDLYNKLIKDKSSLIEFDTEEKAARLIGQWVKLIHETGVWKNSRENNKRHRFQMTSGWGDKLNKVFFVKSVYNSEWTGTMLCGEECGQVSVSQVKIATEEEIESFRVSKKLAKMDEIKTSIARYQKCIDDLQEEYNNLTF